MLLFYLTCLSYLTGLKKTEFPIVKQFRGRQGWWEERINKRNIDSREEGEEEIKSKERETPGPVIRQSSDKQTEYRIYRMKIR